MGSPKLKAVTQPKWLAKNINKIYLCDDREFSTSNHHIWEKSMTTFIQEFVKAAKESPRLYFAPLIGAIRGALTEWDRAIAESRCSQKSQGASYIAAEVENHET